MAAKPTIGSDVAASPARWRSVSFETFSALAKTLNELEDEGFEIKIVDLELRIILARHRDDE